MCFDWAKLANTKARLEAAQGAACGFGLGCTTRLRYHSHWVFGCAENVTSILLQLAGMIRELIWLA